MYTLVNYYTQEFGYLPLLNGCVTTGACVKAFCTNPVRLAICLSMFSTRILQND